MTYSSSEILDSETTKSESAIVTQHRQQEQEQRQLKVCTSVYSANTKFSNTSEIKKSKK
jgi:hypothetical protein